MIWRIALPVLAGVALFAATAYQTEIAQWRRQREEGLEARWRLALGGRTVLAARRREHFRQGSGQRNRAARWPAKAGVFELHNGKVTVKMDGATRELWPDSLDVAKVGRLSLFVIKRSDKYGIRLKDPDSEYRRDFKGIEYYPAKEEYKVTAKWVAAPQKIPILNVLGQTESMDSPGYAVFHLHGQEYRLRPYLETADAKELFYVFRDQTAAKETYGAGRFFYSAMPENGHVVLDFNKAYNPPCAFTPYATCPLPPPENKLARTHRGRRKEVRPLTTIAIPELRRPERPRVGLPPSTGPFVPSQLRLLRQVTLQDCAANRRSRYKPSLQRSDSAILASMLPLNSDEQRSDFLVAPSAVRLLLHDFQSVGARIGVFIRPWMSQRIVDIHHLQHPGQ